ncbi:pleckstrin homology domain-containing family A member 7 isoform X1 [Polypterus senegalus]|uniref:pleckstrin homology domain-containing family A member 7 isoform X1 n=2 Tax=Polypterus senegalus TaxID=55291 RepID=UPI001963E0AE|nr:pleckstrin homology domain-containing family A member 7 isoform X1 [Polypterus senegalus]
MAAPLGRETLPELWSYGVCEDGRVFFINDESRSTTWLHPRTGEPVNSGHMIRSDLPKGWEEGFTNEGASYFINHNQRTTTFRHPITGQVSPENAEFLLQDQPNCRMSRQVLNQRPSSMVSESSTAVTASTVDATSSSSKVLKPSGKAHSFGKRDHAIKRNPNIPVNVRGWLYKQDSTGMRLWKRKWFVLADYCLFYYKDSREENILGSIPLPSYVISPVEPEDHISRKYAFKATHTGMRSYIYNKNSVIGSQAEHSGMRTYYFSADTQEDMNGWIRAMNQAALMQSNPLKRELEKEERQAVPQSNHMNSHKKSTSMERAHRDSGKNEQIKKERQEDERYVCRKDILENKSKVKPSVVTIEGDGPFGDSSQAHPLQRNGPSSLGQQNGSGGGIYKRGLVPRTNVEKQVQRKSNLAQVEHWVKVQKGDNRSHQLDSEPTLSRRTPPNLTQAHIESYQTLPKNGRQPSGSPPPPQLVTRELPSDYKYAHDRVSHFRMSNEERKANKEGTVWQLYEWQQRQQFKHGSPTAPLYTTASDFTDTSGPKATLEVPRSISVPPSPSDIPPPGPPHKVLSPRRPHTPAERVTVKPSDERPLVEIPSPRRLHLSLSKTAHVDRRSLPPMGYMTHTVSAPSLHGKTPEELTLLLIQLRRHQAKMARARSDALAHLQLHDGPSRSTVQADDTYMQLKKDLEYLDLKVSGRDNFKERSMKPVKIAESDVDVKLSRLCEQDKILQDLEAKMRMLKEDKDKLESVLDVSHRQMEQYKDQPAHTEKIAYQQRLLQEDLVHIRAEISQVSTEMENSWNEYGKLEMDVNQLKAALQEHMSRTNLSQQEKSHIQKDLWRIEDVMAGLSSSKANYKITIDSFQNPERKIVPSISSSSVPSLSMCPSERESNAFTQPIPQPSLAQPYASPLQTLVMLQSQPYENPVPKLVDDEAPPRPPLPQIYSPEDQPPAVPPLPKEASVNRHMSVRGLKRQSDERKRDRELGQHVNGDFKVELRSYMSEPELLNVGSGISSRVLGPASGYQTLPIRGLAGSTSALNQSSSISSYVTLRRGLTAAELKERPKSALERLYSGDHQKGRMSAEEQLERMKRHQKALVRERKRTLSQGERQATTSRLTSQTPRPVSADVASWKREQEFDLQLLERVVQGDEQSKPHRDDGLLAVHSAPTKEADLEPQEYDLDISRELSKPEKVLIPERYVDLEPEEPLSREEREERRRKVQRIKSILAKSSVQNVQPAAPLDKRISVDLDTALQEQERIITMSYALASEASMKSKQVAAQQQQQQQASQSNSVSPSVAPLSNGFHYTFV